MPTDKRKVLIIDDDEIFCEMLRLMVEDQGHEGMCAPTLAAGVEAAGRLSPDLVFLDVRMPDGNGLDILPALKALPSNPEVLIVTGLGDPDGAELAITNGAWDYVEKGAPIERITLSFVRALEYRSQRGQAKPLALRRSEIVGDSPRIKECLDMVAQAAASEAGLLITGPTGSGKELFARAVHLNGARSRNPFVVVDCAALPETLVESVLFGHERGAFTSADKARDGLVLQAHTGTLFLDEVGELPLSMQKAFLRVLEERRFRPIGAKQEAASDFRCIAATNRDLEAMARSGRFRSDLLFRLRALHLELPPLCERAADLRQLVRHYADRLSERGGRGVKGFSPGFFDALESYPWPGNVRELFHAVDWAFAAAGSEPILYPKHLPTHIRVHAARASVAVRVPEAEAQASRPEARPEHGPSPEPFPSFREHRRRGTRDYLVGLLSLTAGDLRRAVRISGLSRSRFYALLKEHGLEA